MLSSGEDGERNCLAAVNAFFQKVEIDQVAYSIRLEQTKWFLLLVRIAAAKKEDV